MRRYFISIITFAAVALATLVSCEKDPMDRPDKDPRSALERYWADDYAGKMGIQVQAATIQGTQQPRMYIGGKLLYVTGMNCYNLFNQSFSSGRFNLDKIKNTVEVFKKEQVPIVRFACCPYYAKEFTYYMDKKTDYLAALDTLASLCDRAHVALIPSFFWNTGAAPDYYGEEYKAWGNTSSKTYAFMVQYVNDIVNTLKGHKSLVAWEFGNEFNLGADIPHNFTISAKDEEVALKGFAETVKAADPEGRLITSGNSIMRNAQYHMWTEKSWTNDTFDQYKEISAIFTPDPMMGISEHVYEDKRVFSDINGGSELQRTDQMAYAKKMAASLGKVYYVGEFTGPKTAQGDSLMIRKHLIAYYAQRVQVSLMWNYAYKADIEYSFKHDTPYGNMAFNMMREYNEKFKTVSE